MDYITLPKQSATTPPRVPLYGEPYDVGEDFLTYPARAGSQWRLVLQDEGEYPFFIHDRMAPTDDKALQSFFQTWLFFGLLQELFVPHQLYDSSHYLDRDQDKTYVHMRLFADTLKKWATIARSASPTEKEVIKRRLVSCLKLTHLSLQVFYRFPGEKTDSHPNFDEGLRDSIAILGATIQGACDQCLDDVLPDLRWPRFTPFMVFTEADRELMLWNGWCPSAIDQQERGHTSVSYRYFIKNMMIPNAGQDHGACNNTKCDFETINPETYAPLHVEDKCECDSIMLSLEKIKTCLEAGTFPILDIIGKDIHDMSLEIVPFREGQRYVALSHVWADGLGNPRGNGLPSCQIFRLQKLLQAAAADSTLWSDDVEREAPAGRIYLWCDSLLVPASDQGSTSVDSPPEQVHDGASLPLADPVRLRDLSLNLMREVYLKATAALVLERTLSALNYGDIDPLEAGVRILCSRYHQRLWTYQEAALPERVLIQFQDRAVGMKELLLRTKEVYNTDPVQREFAFGVVGGLISLRLWRGLEHLGGPNLSNMFWGIRHRRCSNINDEPLCASTILSLDQTEIIAAKRHDHRMREFWNAAANHVFGIPQNIIFHHLPRLWSVEGYRWAPSTFQEGPNNFNRTFCDPTSGRQAVLKRGEGLEVQYPGYRIRMNQSRRITGFHATMKQVVSQGELHMKLPGGNWCSLSLRGGGQFSEGKKPRELLEADLKKDWYLIRCNEEFFGSDTQPVALLGEMVTRGSKQVFVCRQDIMLHSLKGTLNTGMKASEKHAQTLQNDPDLRKLHWLTIIQNLLELIARLSPRIVHRLMFPMITRAIRRTVSDWRAYYLSRIKNTIKMTIEPERQAPEVRQALSAMAAMPPGNQDLYPLLMINFTGHYAVIEEEFDQNHRWIVD